jgi:hypothetical protein
MDMATIEYEELSTTEAHSGAVFVSGGTFRMGSDKHYPEEAPPKTPARNQPLMSLSGDPVAAPPGADIVPWAQFRWSSHSILLCWWESTPRHWRAWGADLPLRTISCGQNRRQSWRPGPHLRLQRTLNGILK